MELYRQLPIEAVKIFLVLFLSFLIGAEREERKTPGTYFFGGVRAFPLIGLIGYSLAFLCGSQLVPLLLGFLAVAGFLLLSYWHKLQRYDASGVTTEMSGLTTFLVGALVCYGHFWIATTLGVASLLLLDLKAGLEKLASRIAPKEILTFAKFLFLTGVVLPVLPNQQFGPFHINPFKTWLVVAAISTISYASYVLQKVAKGQGGIVLSALLGGAYSSTVTTVVLARQSKNESRPFLYSGGILMASGMMYLRILILLALFSRPLMDALLIPFATLAVCAVLTGWLWSRRADGSVPAEKRDLNTRNPLEITTALLFALLFLVMLVATQLAVTYLGRAGINTLAGVMGLADVDPFIMGLTQDAGSLTPVKIAAGAVIIAAASNNFMKGIYAFSLAEKRTGRFGIAFLLSLAAGGLLPLLWIGL